MLAWQATLMSTSLRHIDNAPQLTKQPGTAPSSSGNAVSESKPVRRRNLVHRCCKAA